MKEPKRIRQLLDEIHFRDAEIQRLTYEIFEMKSICDDAIYEIEALKNGIEYKESINDDEDYDKLDPKDKKYIYVNLEEFIEEQNGTFSKKQIDDYRQYQIIDS